MNLESLGSIVFLCPDISLPRQMGTSNPKPAIDGLEADFGDRNNALDSRTPQLGIRRPWSYLPTNA
jgi:hypothetical protein